MAKDELKGGHTRRLSMFANGVLGSVLEKLAKVEC